MARNTMARNTMERKEHLRVLNAALGSDAFDAFAEPFFEAVQPKGPNEVEFLNKIVRAAWDIELENRVDMANAGINPFQSDENQVIH